MDFVPTPLASARWLDKCFVRAFNTGHPCALYAREAMFINFGAHFTTIDYNPILLRTSRMSFMSIDEWEKKRPQFDVGFSISSFEHDGLGAYGDPIDPDGDLKAMAKMKERIKPGGLLFLAVPTGKDKVVFNQARIYGRLRLPMLMQGWDCIDRFGFREEDLDGNGSVQPVYVLRNGFPKGAVPECLKITD